MQAPTVCTLSTHYPLSLLSTFHAPFSSPPHASLNPSLFLYLSNPNTYQVLGTNPVLSATLSNYILLALQLIQQGAHTHVCKHAHAHTLASR